MVFACLPFFLLYLVRVGSPTGLPVACGPSGRGKKERYDRHFCSPVVNYVNGTEKHTSFFVLVHSDHCSGKFSCFLLAVAGQRFLLVGWTRKPALGNPAA